MDISGELCSLSGLDMLTGQAVERVLSVSGWDGERRNPAKQWATTWRRDDAHAWIQGAIESGLRAAVEVHRT